MFLKFIAQPATQAVLFPFIARKKNLDRQPHRILSEGGFEMKGVRQLAENKVIEKGMTALLKEIGPADTIRFLHISPQKREESVSRHRKWQKLLDKEKFFKSVF
jgi:hypothetical protein